MDFVKKMVGLFIAVSGLSACSIFSPIKTDMTNYQIIAVPTHVTYQRTRPISLLVNQPYATGTINTVQMAYTIKPFQIAYFAKNRWADLPSNMLLPLMVKTLQKTHLFHAVGPLVQLAHYDYYLNTNLLEFQQVFFAKGSVYRITLWAQLVNARNNHIIATKEFMAEAPAPYYGPYGGAIAANHATAEVLAELAQWCGNVIKHK